MPPRTPGRPPTGSTRDRGRAARDEACPPWLAAQAATPGCVAAAVRALGPCPGRDAAVDLLEALRPASTPWLLESSLVDGRLGRHSLLGVDPYALVCVRGERVELDVRRAVRPGWPLGRTTFEADPFELVRLLWPRLERASDGLPLHPALPFLGGAVAVFGYELAERIETLGLGSRDDLRTPDLVLLMVDRLASIDHASGELMLSALGFGPDAASARRRSEAALSEWQTRVEAARVRAPSATHVGTSPASDAASTAPMYADGLTSAHAPVAGAPASRAAAGPSLDAGADRPAGEASDSDAEKDAGLDPGPGAEEYARRVRSILADIERGNVYEVNLTQRMSVPFEAAPLALYRALRAESPAPFAAYLELPDVTVVGSSPERFLKLGADGHVESRPIKGTRPRGVTPDRDAALAEELVTSPKDRAENLMIVDLVRNDLGRVCELGSVRVPGLMQVEAYATVFQLVSTVVGRLRRDCDGIDLVRACFPPGSMTGAPKIAAMRIAGALEPVRRGIYSGALGYLDVRGGLDLSVVIRSWLVKDGRAHLHVGGAVVADSDPAAEYEETLDKARALRAALERVAR